ncbi:MAG TPA: hypothetical protein DEV81_18745 [Cyanobacteria bacterium UBA11049]|nr:hypothetical protein [Cyanobacteria bacterium UBA11049]
MPKRSFEIRLRATVEVGSAEETLLEFLDNKEATPYPKIEMLIMAAETLWLPLAYKYKQRSPEEVLQTMYDVIYRWQRHEQYLQNKTGIRVNYPEIIPIRQELWQQAEVAERNQMVVATAGQEKELLGKKPYNPFGDEIVSTQQRQ